MSNDQPHDAGHQAAETHRLTVERIAAEQQQAQQQAAADRARLAAFYARQRAQQT